MAKIEKFQDLIIWQRSTELAEAVYLVSGQYSADVTFGFVSQMRRAATAIPSHIAEGFGRYEGRKV